jgi:hypothetical protein
LLDGDAVYSALSRDGWLYAEKAARSVSEIQGNISGVTDVIVFLEVLGYNDSAVNKFGFANLSDFAAYIFDFVDFFRAESVSAQSLDPPPKIKGATGRVLEGLALAFPIVGMLGVLLIFGVSLWMTRVLPVQITTAFLSGVFLGILISEGPSQAFNRLFSLYYTQGNIGEAKRILNRNGSIVLTALIVSGSALLLMGFTVGLPLSLILITIFATGTIALHRASYLVIFSLKKLGQMVAAYTAALTALVLVYFYTPQTTVDLVLRYIPSHLLDSAPDVLIRYFLALLAAFVILSVPAVYYYSKVMSSKTSAPPKAPRFYAPFSIGDKTVPSRLGVQLWETLPYFIFGTFFFLMIFADRIISWIFNPFITDYGTLPLEFNSTYHIGADPALVILLATTVISYVLLAPIYDQLGQASSRVSISDAGSIEDILQSTYKRLLIASITASTALALVMNYEGLEVMRYLGGGLISLQIFRVATIADVFLSIFFVNAMFLTLVNKIKVSAIISVICALIVVVVGTIFGFAGFQNIIWAYLLSSFVSMLLSTTYCVRLGGRFSKLFLSRFV